MESYTSLQEQTALINKDHGNKKDSPLINDSTSNNFAEKGDDQNNGGTIAGQFTSHVNSQTRQETNLVVGDARSSFVSLDDRTMSQSSVAPSIEGTINADYNLLYVKKSSDGMTMSSKAKKRRSRTINTSSFAL